jgi:hypothetical protein
MAFLSSDWCGSECAKALPAVADALAATTIAAPCCRRLRREVSIFIIAKFLSSFGVYDALPLGAADSSYFRGGAPTIMALYEN